jgi:small subunit ribosomal protein S2
MTRLPDAVFILDTKKEHIGVTEARKLKIPVVAVVDTNCDPDVIDFPIPGNDDAIRSGTLMCRIIADAVEEGKFIHSKRNPGAAAPVIVRSAEEQTKIDEQQADARRQASAQAAEREARIAAAQAAQAEPAAAEPAAESVEVAEPAAEVAEPAAVETAVDTPEVVAETAAETTEA